MASTLKINTLTGVTTAGSIAVTGEGNSTTTNLQQGLAKAWSNHNMSGETARDSFNVSTINDNAAGDHSITVTNAFGSANYVWSYGGKRASGDGVNPFDCAHIRSVDPTTTVTRHNVKDHDSSDDVDAEILCVIFHGDLA